MSKPLRNNVGVCLFNRGGLVLLARRFKDDGPEVIQKGFEWQMPQGGIHDGEAPFDAALRELFEETGVAKVEYLDEMKWVTYKFPPYQGSPCHRLAPFSGQRQKWFALRFSGKDDEIDVDVTRNGEPPEFDAWRWEKLANAPDLVVSYKREVYRQVVKSFISFSHSI
jgi:putative (di)nucleoside polyphosphate hydrolase